MSSGVGMKIAGIAGVLVVLAGGAGAAYAFSDTVKNQVKLATSSPEDYYAWVYEKNTREVAALFENSYQQYSDRMGGSSGEVALEFAPSADVKEFLIDEMLGGDTSDPDSQKMADLINGINSLEISVSSSNSDSVAAGSMKLRRNGEDVTAMDLASDMQAGTAYLRIPDLTARWIGIDLADYMDDADMAAFSGAPSADIAPSALAECVTKYSEILYQNAQNITVEKKQPVQIVNFTTEYTAMTATVTESELLDRLIRLTDTASTDSVLKQLFPEEANFSGTMLDAGDALRQLRESGLVGNDTMDVVTYVDGSGNIRGYYAKIGSIMTVFCANGMADKQVGAEMQITVQGKSLFDIEASGTTGDHGLTGTLKASVDDGSGSAMNMSFTFSDLEIVNVENGYVNGLVTMDLPEMDTIQITLSSDGSAQNLTCPIVAEDMQIGDLTLRYAVQEEGSAVMPDTSDVYQLRPQQEFRLSEYVTEAELSAYVTGVLERLGVSSGDAAQIGESVGALVAFS